MKRVPVRSTAIRSAAYDRDSSVLEIEFITRLVYQYQRVPRALFRALMAAKSKGRFFNEKIKDHFAGRLISGHAA